jgi:isoquinoline 1-oxidoreductase beta subunit
VARQSGNVVEALARCPKVVRAVYELPFLAHATMEPMNCVADVRPDRCEIWASTQDPRGFRRRAAALAGIDEEHVTVHTTLLGGGFGRQFEADVLAEAVQCSRTAGAPVKVTWTREDDLTHDFYRPASYHELAGGLDAKGTLVAFTHRIVAPSIEGQRDAAAIRNGLDESAVEGAADLPYAIPHLRVDYVMANTPVPIGYWRSVYPSQNVFATESFIDELAHAAGKDPLDFRRALLTDNPRMRRVLDLAADRSGWSTAPAPGRARGIALSPPAFFRTPVAQVAEVSLGANGLPRVHRVVAAIDCGIAVNPDGVAAQMEGGVAFGLTAALYGRVTVIGGRVTEDNFDSYPLLAFDDMPVVDTLIVPSTDPPSGTGEPGLPAIAPAVTNALFRLTGTRIRQLPLQRP